MKRVFFIFQIMLVALAALALIGILYIEIAYTCVKSHKEWKLTYDFMMDSPVMDSVCVCDEMKKR